MALKEWLKAPLKSSIRSTFGQNCSIPGICSGVASAAPSISAYSSITRITSASAGTNRVRRKGIFPGRGPLARGEGEYTVVRANRLAIRSPSFFEGRPLHRDTLN
eukprot:59551-Prorocentrum_minimum.AAC.2